MSYPQLTGAASTAEVRAAVEGAREALAALHRHPANVRGWPRTAAAAAVRAARASAILDGGSGAIDTD
ncbi:MAG: oxidoreductase, partial [Actinomycetota bacterium]|nr:oxidoreductase [Actinomycetota bacterium]